MKKKNTSKSLTILDSADDDLNFVPNDSDDDDERFLYDNLKGDYDSDDELQPVIVNREEFLQTQTRAAPLPKSRSRSASPPRRTVVEEDDVVYRDKSGRRITKEQWLILHQNDVKADRKAKKDHPRQELVWGKGLVQKEDLEEKRKREEKLAAEPLNRYDIPEDYDLELQTKQRWNDPLNRMTDTIEDDKVPKCRFAAVPNRFSINPGYRWDGVIRGNGYEERWFKAQSDRNVKLQEYYMSNIADM